MEKSKTKEKNVLLFTAHPDDHLLCAGTLMLLKEKGFSITEVVFTGGEESVWFGEGEDKKDKEKLKQKRKDELSKASKIIGISQTIVLGEPDSEVSRSLNLIHRVMAVVREIKPAIVLTLNPTDYHPDHRAVSSIVTEAVDRASWGVAEHLGAPHRADMLLYTDGEYMCRADFLVDTSRFEEKIEKAMDAYGSQMRDKHRRLSRSIRMYRSFFKRQSTSAEAFEIGERYPINLELLSLLS